MMDTIPGLTDTTTCTSLAFSESHIGGSHNFKSIQAVPSSAEFLDIVLSKTQRKTPTVVHKGYQISRIRSFYMRKVKFTQSTFDERLQQIITDFPKIEEVHPFYADLMNVLYDRDHYKLALGQVATAKQLINQIGKEYLKLLKFGDSLYRCKQLKKAALGRMATLMKRQKDALSYLEQVRQHLSRLPTIEPATRTLLICGYPNVGKSSFINKVSRAMVDVQPYAFTTKSLFVGHFDYQYQRWQVIDTPGILDHPLEQRNTIEMQSITALAHIRAAVMFFVDLSERCGYSLEQQLSLFESLKPLIRSKPVVIVANKCDLVRIADLDPVAKEQLEAAALSSSAIVLETSTITDENVMGVRNAACDRLLMQNLPTATTTAMVSPVSKLRVAMPVSRDGVLRPPIIPRTVLECTLVPEEQKMPLLRDIELQCGGPGVFSFKMTSHHLISDWLSKPIAEIVDGKNIADFIDPDIEERLASLEMEEEEQQSRHHDLSQRRSTVLQLRKQRQQSTVARERSRLLGRLGRRDRLPRSEIVSGGDGGNCGNVLQGPRPSRSRSQSRFRDHALSERSRSRITQRLLQGHGSVVAKTQTSALAALSQRQRSRMGRAGDSDRRETASLAKHLYSGKRGLGTTNRR